MDAFNEMIIPDFYSRLAIIESSFYFEYNSMLNNEMVTVSLVISCYFCLHTVVSSLPGHARPVKAEQRQIRADKLYTQRPGLRKETVSDLNESFI